MISDLHYLRLARGARQVVHNHQTIWVDVQLCISSSSAPGYFSAKDIVLHRLQLCKENHWSTRQLEILIRIRYLETNAVRCLSWWMGAAQFQVWQLTSFICTLQSHAHPACLTVNEALWSTIRSCISTMVPIWHGLHHRFQRMCQSTFDKGMWLWWQSDAARSVPSQSIGAAHFQGRKVDTTKTWDALGSKSVRRNMQQPRRYAPLEVAKRSASGRATTSLNKRRFTETSWHSRKKISSCRPSGGTVKLHWGSGRMTKHCCCIPQRFAESILHVQLQRHRSWEPKEVSLATQQAPLCRPELCSWRLAWHHVEIPPLWNLVASRRHHFVTLRGHILHWKKLLAQVQNWGSKIRDLPL